MHVAHHRPVERKAGFGKQAAEPRPDQRTITVKEVEGGNVDCSWEKKRTVSNLGSQNVKRMFCVTLSLRCPLTEGKGTLNKDSTKMA